MSYFNFKLFNRPVKNVNTDLEYKKPNKIEKVTASTTVSFSDITNVIDFNARINTIATADSDLNVWWPLSLGPGTDNTPYKGVYNGPSNGRFSLPLPTNYNHISITYNNPHPPASSPPASGGVFIFLGGVGSGALPAEPTPISQAVDLIYNNVTGASKTYSQFYTAGDYLKIQEWNAVITTALVVKLSLLEPGEAPGWAPGYPIKGGRAPILGYRKTVDCSNNCQNEKIYKDNWAKSCARNGEACYNPVIKRIQNNNRKPAKPYNYNTRNLLRSRFSTYEQNAYNFDLSGNLTAWGGGADPANNSYKIHDCSCNAPFTSNNPCIATYKPLNRQFAVNTAVSGRSRIARLKYNTKKRVAVTKKIPFGLLGYPKNSCEFCKRDFKPSKGKKGGDDKRRINSRLGVPFIPPPPPLLIIAVGAIPGASPSYITIQYNQSLGTPPAKENFTVVNTTQVWNKTPNSTNIITTTIANDTVELEFNPPDIKNADVLQLTYTQVQTPFISNPAGVIADNIINLSITAPGIADTNFLTEVDAWLNTATSSYGNISTWDVSQVTDMSTAFSATRNPNAATFNNDIGSWNTSSVTNMSSMFEGAAAFNNGTNATFLWDTTVLTNMSNMFKNATSFNRRIDNQANLSKWQQPNLNNISSIFEGATAFNNGDSNAFIWYTLNITDMSSAFKNATSFTNGGVSNGGISFWQTQNVTNMSEMFSGATAFNTQLNTWNVNSVTNMSGMFKDATAFNNNGEGMPNNGNLWKTDGVTDMSSMFQNAGSFNQDLSTWRLDAITVGASLENCFNNSGLSGQIWAANDSSGGAANSWYTKAITLDPSNFYKDGASGNNPSGTSQPIFPNFPIQLGSGTSWTTVKTKLDNNSLGYTVYQMETSSVHSGNTWYKLSSTGTPLTAAPYNSTGEVNNGGDASGSQSFSGLLILVIDNNDKVIWKINPIGDNNNNGTSYAYNNAATALTLSVNYVLKDLTDFPFVNIL